MASDMNQNDLSSKSDQQKQVEDEVTINIKEMIKDCGHDLLLSESCIYRVPITLRHLKQEVYTPKVVSIGPFHHGSERLKDMERHKHILFKRFTQRAASSMDDLVRFVKCLLPKVRASYSETIKLTEQKLVELTLMDASFIIELFISAWTCEVGEDAKLLKPWLDVTIHLDLLLLENQLPFFVIEEMFNKAFPHDRRGSLPSFLELTYKFFKDYNIQDLKPNPEVKIKHFTDLLRLFYLPATMSQGDPLCGNQILLYKATTLKEAGIKFKASKSKCPLDLKFSGHQLEIPQIVVTTCTELLFGNMIALEQCHYPYHTYITDYIVMLDYLVDTSKDADLLVHNRIVLNWLGDTNNVALLFNGLAVNALQVNFNSEYWVICKNLNHYCQGCWHKMKATLRRDYCRTPWQIVASIAAIVLLLLTVAQTIFAILQVVNK